MTNLYRLQTLLVLFFLSVFTSQLFGQLADPIRVNVKNAGSYTDQFSGSTAYSFGIVQDVNSQIGTANITQGSNGNTLRVDFTPDPGVVGTTDLIVSFFTLSDPMHPVTRWYRFDVTHEVVVTTNDHFVIDSGASDIVLDVLANDSVDNSQLTISTVSISNHGDASLNAEGSSIIFTPFADFSGDTWLQYIACDTDGNCAPAEVHILVRNPEAQDHVLYTKSLLNTESLDILTPFDGFTIEDPALHGTLSNNYGAAWEYIPDPGFTGKDTFSLGLVGLVTRTYHVTVYEKSVNVHARDDRFYVRPGLSVTFNVLNNDLLDYEVSSRSNPSKGYISEVSNGIYTYSPIQGFRGVDKFTYTTCYEDTVYCETATVLIHVTDLEPDNLFTYKLQTSRELPLTIDYPIEYTDFSYIINVEPEHGQLVNYDGLHQINLPCDTLDSYNMLVYEPEPGYTGTDYFEYYYCIVPSNICFLVKAEINVIDAPETESCPCVIDCVWPGDGDKDGRVDMADLLHIANRLGETGVQRNYQSGDTWFGQHAPSWPGDAGVSHLDANGDGQITALDIDPVSNHYYQTHDVVVRDVNQKLPYQFSLIPVQFSLDSGDLVILDIALGNANNPVIDLKGAKFSINMPPAMMDSATLTLDFHHNSWLAEGAPFVSLAKVPWAGRLDGGFARAKGNGATGFGVIATTTFIIVDDLEGFKTNNGLIQIPITLSSGSVMGSDGILYEVEGHQVMLTYEANTGNNYQLILYPNPAQDLVNIHLNGKTVIHDITIVDAQGRIIQHNGNINLKQHSLNVTHLPAGLYYVQVKHQHGVEVQPLSIVR